MQQRISASAYQALRDAIAVVFWYRPSLSRYLASAFRANPEVVSGIDFMSMTKREAADELIDRLSANELRYKSATLQLMLEIANMESFPELDRHEDSDKLLAQAQDAVAELKRQTAKHEELLLEKERIEAARRSHAQQAALERRFADDLQTLQSQFMALSACLGLKPQERGIEFEKFLNDFFGLFDLDPRLSYRIPHQQVDGAFTFDTDDYILEAKWTKEKTSKEQADSFATKVGRMGKNALGLIVSFNSVSRGAIAMHNRNTSFMTLDGADIFAVLEQRVRLDDLLRRKKRHANETGECYYPVAKLFE